MEALMYKRKYLIKGELQVPGDKSISHRAVILGSIANGRTEIVNFLDSEDCMRTVEAFRLMGVSIQKNDNVLIIDGKGLHGLVEPTMPLYFGNSGTTARLMLGLLSGLPFSTLVYGDKSLTKRPMERVIKPLQQMGVQTIGRKESNYLPLALRGGSLTGITYNIPVKSAQVKSALLLAGLLANGKTTVIEQGQTRNHSENMLKAFGASIEVEDNMITIDSSMSLKATDVYIPGDISSAAFLMAAAAIIPGSNLVIKNVGLNETRTGFLDVLTNMGGLYTLSNIRDSGGETIGDISITYNELTGTVISGEIVPRLIDEIPIIALLATQAKGKTIIKDASELRVKETDRIQAVVDVLTKLGANIVETKDGMEIVGGTNLTGGTVSSYDDHRIAMMIVIASLVTTDIVKVDELQSIAISYPRFMQDLESVLRNM
ncbi:3-phosphoshikimate 1-carboxyvinyltransferase [Ornithinibacillus bavariensis]|uniref:3-phosphoshikimate 1-carboxyvinyltransferase n=2 Tax=Ornithinibacillus bavariensis TaxID=545502 RepID=A0A920C736_9BACI|nr:3-phosphoshikimate 1-carboxyvinyltransferase [Ornithinibacillus bavariensis]